jgi:Nucleotidyl transferase AbiEii toxin, Type IV TA system
LSRESRQTRFSYLPVLDPVTSVMPAQQLRAWSTLGEVPDEFVLYGGTGLAVRLGHRDSEDFDFFSAEPFSPTELLADLAWLGRVTVGRTSANNLEFVTADGVHFAFFGGMRIQCVAEPSLVKENGLVVASVFDLAGTKAKTILDRSEWKDYIDLATILRAGLSLIDVIGYATTIFDPLFEFPAAAFLRSLVYFEEGTAGDVPADVRRDLELAVVRASREPIPKIEAYSPSVLP